MMEWNDSYSVGVPTLDSQHKQLFVYFNEFYAAMSHNHGQVSVHEVLRKCCQYALTHFRTEEAWMEQNHFPELAEHREEHRQFAAQAEKLLADSQAGKLVLSGNVSRMLRQWLTHHIMGSDKKYAAFAARYGIRS